MNSKTGYLRPLNYENRSFFTIELFWGPVSLTWTQHGSGAHLSALSPYPLFSPLPLLCSLLPALRTLPCSLPPASRGATLPPPLVPPADAGCATASLLPPRTTWRVAAMELGLTGDGDGIGWVAKGQLGSFNKAGRIMCAPSASRHTVCRWPATSSAAHPWWPRWVDGRWVAAQRMAGRDESGTRSGRPRGSSTRE